MRIEMKRKWIWAQSLCWLNLFWGFILHLEVLEVEEPKPIASDGRQTAKGVKVNCGQKQTSLKVKKVQSEKTESLKRHTKSTREQRSYLMFVVVKSVWTWGLRKGQAGLFPLTLTHTRGRPRRPALTSPSGCPDILNKKVRKSRCIERKSGIESCPELKSLSRPLHP